MAKANRNVINSHKKFKFNAIQVDFDVDFRLFHANDKKKAKIAFLISFE